MTVEKHHFSRFCSFLFVLFLLISIKASAQTKVRVRFAKGASSASVKGITSRYKYVDYIVSAKSGQTMSITLVSKNAACSFSVYHSDMKDVADGRDITEFTRNIDTDNRYVVRAMLRRSSARRKESAAFTLNIKIQ